MNKDSFLKVSKEFSLGNLTTEGFNPITEGLSRLVNTDIEKAIKALKDVDLNALSCLEKYVDSIFELHNKCQETLKNNKRIFLCGCGATGRLALSLEFLYLKKFKSNDVISFMAGGDFALIKSVESFEDKMSYGARQLKELGFEDGDLLIAITEGGETSFVIGAAMEAKKISKNNPFFLYCNPNQELENIERSKLIIRDELIHKINLTTGPMALSGSTRMQATTVQMFAVAQALFNQGNFNQFKENFIKDLIWLKELDYNLIKDFINWEANIYKSNGYLTYLSDPNLAIAVLTDTTERSPTFSLAPFEKIDEDHLGLCYLAIKGEINSENAWKKLLGRTPRAIDWPNLNQNIGLEEIYKFDISEKSVLRRQQKSLKHFVFEIIADDEKLFFKNQDLEKNISIKAKPNYLIHLALKLYLNTLSTLIMGINDRYESNVMTWVKASNYKLIDRAARYVMKLANEKEVTLVYEDVIEEIFNKINEKNNSPIVLNVLNSLLLNSKK